MYRFHTTLRKAGVDSWIPSERSTTGSPQVVIRPGRRARSDSFEDSPPAWGGAFGQMILESLSRGIPVVAFGIGPVPELVRHGETGYCGYDMLRSGSAPPALAIFTAFAQRAR